MYVCMYVAKLSLSWKSIPLPILWDFALFMYISHIFPPTNGDNNNTDCF